MNTAIVARLFFFVMAAFMLAGFTAAAQDKMPDKTKSEMKHEKVVSTKHYKHTQKAIKTKAEKGKKAEKKKDDQPR